jgi:nitroimidazol reductase NimA-like FMN-containing flavoprotein (pyridoxamine 5'-phosphate oxidase superfamily)
MGENLRRQDREITNPEAIREILREGKLCHLALVDRGKPYLLTMNYGYRDNVLYFHCAPEGRKIDMIREEPEVCFQVIIDTKLVTGENACRDWTMKYKSVVGYGRASLIEDREDKAKALNILMDQYSKKGPFDFPRENLDETAIIQVEVTGLSGKISGY